LATREQRDAVRFGEQRADQRLRCREMVLVWGVPDRPTMSSAASSPPALGSRIRSRSSVAGTTGSRPEGRLAAPSAIAQRCVWKASQPALSAASVHRRGEAVRRLRVGSSACSRRAFILVALSEDVVRTATSAVRRARASPDLPLERSTMWPGDPYGRAGAQEPLALEVVEQPDEVARVDSHGLGHACWVALP